MNFYWNKHERILHNFIVTFSWMKKKIQFIDFDTVLNIKYYHISILKILNFMREEESSGSLGFRRYQILIKRIEIFIFV